MDCILVRLVDGVWELCGVNQGKIALLDSAKTYGMAITRAYKLCRKFRCDMCLATSSNPIELLSDEECRRLANGLMGIIMYDSTVMARLDEMRDDAHHAADDLQPDLYFALDWLMSMDTTPEVSN